MKYLIEVTLFSLASSIAVPAIIENPSPTTTAPSLVAIAYLAPPELDTQASAMQVRKSTTPPPLYHLYNCYDPDWGGRCLNMEAKAQQCYNLVDGWADQISSSGPSHDDMTCVLYTAPNCDPNVRASVLKWPGSSDLRTLGIDDQAQSFKCNTVRYYHDAG